MNVESITLVIKSRGKNLAYVNETVEEFAAKLNFSNKSKRYLSVICDEIFSNIVKYAYPQEEGNIIFTVTSVPEKDQLVMSFSDTGIPFNPLTADEVDLSLPPDKRPVGKMGLHIVRKLAKSVSYKREDEKNVLTIILEKTQEINI